MHCHRILLDMVWVLQHVLSFDEPLSISKSYSNYDAINLGYLTTNNIIQTALHPPHSQHEVDLIYKFLNYIIDCH